MPQIHDHHEIFNSETPQEPKELCSLACARTLTPSQLSYLTRNHLKDLRVGGCLPFPTKPGNSVESWQWNPGDIKSHASVLRGYFCHETAEVGLSPKLVPPKMKQRGQKGFLHAAEGSCGISPSSGSSLSLLLVGYLTLGWIIPKSFLPDKSAPLGTDATLCHREPCADIWPQEQKHPRFDLL